jgi:hypothetical protein
VNGDVTTFAWDWATGVPEMLSEGENLYLAAHDTLGSWDGDEGDHLLPFALHTYAYALASPANFLDPSGLYTCRNEDGPPSHLGYFDEGMADNIVLTQTRLCKGRPPRSPIILEDRSNE